MTEYVDEDGNPIELYEDGEGGFVDQYDNPVEIDARDERIEQLEQLLIDGEPEDDEDELMAVASQYIQWFEETKGRSLTRREIKNVMRDLADGRTEPSEAVANSWRTDLSDRDTRREWMVEKLADADTIAKADAEDRQYAAEAGPGAGGEE